MLRGLSKPQMVQLIRENQPPETLKQECRERPFHAHR